MTRLFKRASKRLGAYLRFRAQEAALCLSGFFFAKGGLI